MNEALTLIRAGLAGVVLGVFFFGGLWWTVRRGLSSPRPELWFFGSPLLRMGVAVTGFYFVSGGYWARLVVSLAGFVIARLAVTWLTRTSKTPGRAVPEVAHAPYL